MVIHDPYYPEDEPFSRGGGGNRDPYHAAPHHHQQPLAPGAVQRPRAAGGLVQSRVQFFETPETKRMGPPTQEQHHQTHHPSDVKPSKVALASSTSKVVPYPYQPHQQHGQSAPNMPLPPSQSTSSQKVTSRAVQHYSRAPQTSMHRFRYPDSFSDNNISNLQAIDESRQEDFSTARQAASTPRSATPSSSSSSSPYSPLLETGIDHYMREEYVLAEKAFVTALKTQHANNNINTMSPRNAKEADLSIALLMGNLGAVYLKQNRIQEAMEMLESSLELKKKLGSKVIVADTYNNLGNCANLLGNYEDSLEYYRLALQELRRKRGRKSDVADALFNIGRLEIHRENFKSADGILQEALRMAKEVYGDDHVYIAEASDLLGFVQVSLGEYDGALISFTKGLEVYRNLHGSLHPDVANAIFNIGMVRESSHDYPDAWEAYNTAQDLYRRLGTSPEDPSFRTVRRSLAHVEKLIAQMNQTRLMEKHQQAVSKKKKKEGSRSQRSSFDASGSASGTAAAQGETSEASATPPAE